MRTGAIALFCFSGWLICLSQLHLATDTLKADEKIADINKTLVSIENKFKLGFFSPSGSTGKYLGIWYYNLQPQTIVWVANRDKPVVDSTPIFQIAEDGNLVVSDTNGKRYWSSSLKGSSSSSNRTVKLTDSGNLVLQDYELKTNVWESFQHPTDTFLPSMEMNRNTKLVSWRDSNDPSQGTFTFGVDQTGDNNLYTIWKNQNQIYWKSGRISSDTMPPAVASLLTNSNLTTRFNYSLTRIVMNSTGRIEFQRYENNFENGWNTLWSEPSDNCKVYNACGNFSSCNIQDRPQCKCLPGFYPISQNTESPAGCMRKSASCETKKITFLNLTMVQVGNSGNQFPAESEMDCKSQCFKAFNSCCQAYSYDAVMPDRSSTSTCSIWNQDLLTIQEDSPDKGISIYVRVLTSDIEPTPKTCEPCGTIEIPYPLSTGPDCGDPMYSKLSCNDSTGLLSFMMQNRTFRVANIDQEHQTLSIQFEDSNYNPCSNKDQQYQLDSPFNVTDWCFGRDEIKVSWLPPLEPLCNVSTDCNVWPHSTCNVARDGKRRCVCNTNYSWNNSTLNCTQAEFLGLPIRKESHARKSSLSLILGVTLSAVAFLACMIALAYVWRRKIAHKKGKGRVQKVRGRMYDSERHLKDLINSQELEEKNNEGIEVPYYEFESILEATDNFSDANKLGQGGYGPVYKGRFEGGEDMAVKRLSSVSSQGLKEFKNEVVLISKLQHRNLVKLRGYCIKGEEKILLYEYMPNRSLDSFIFDGTQGLILDWQMRFDIILGVARGMLYLHQDSRLRVIHRDLKTSNILLDGEMQPKISDFGLARIFGGKETEANTDRVVGTYGYMAPEYALDGLFSIKSDVFSFGVMILEIISGKKNVGFFKSEKTSSLLGYAWWLWAEDKLLDLMDQSVSENCDSNEFIRCALVGLLCVQDEPNERPTMSHVMRMLESETSSLPTPKQPTFFINRGHPSTASSSSKPATILETDTIYQEGR